MESVIFTNDDNVSVLLIDHSFSSRFKSRDNHEVLFRRINTYLIKNKLITANIIDLRAWNGDNSIPWAKNINATIYAIDPSADNCDFIKRTCELNEIKNVKIIQSAISNTNELLSTNEHITHCSFVYGNPGINGSTKITAVSLDYLYELKTIENIGYMDVEGMEYKIIDKCRPIVFIAK